MKKATKIAFGAVAVLAVSAGVAGVTTYTLMQSRQDKNLSFYDEFQTASNVRYAALDATSMQPIDLTKAAESSLNSVVHIMSVQRLPINLSVKSDCCCTYIPCVHAPEFSMSQNIAGDLP